jgi:hypothetical protein
LTDPNIERGAELWARFMADTSTAPVPRSLVAWRRWSMANTRADEARAIAEGLRLWEAARR